MGRTKFGNANARNNNAKHKNELKTEFASYAEVEVKKMSNEHKNIR